ncbi:hypothetical protein SETIT_7G071100v2 [Setaria italica]|uniref:Uncharacterized protein n=1 Tax=Setaria italica TaxID=4555 RepID=A0A368RT20_SETIT|nr:hypothetical protein SETIT_7G071100v2 [Setaria italica]
MYNCSEKYATNYAAVQLVRMWTSYLRDLSSNLCVESFFLHFIFFSLPDRAAQSSAPAANTCAAAVAEPMATGRRHTQPGSNCCCSLLAPRCFLFLGPSLLY